jgi:peptide/nickel transport system substrate-binding protein
MIAGAKSVGTKKSTTLTRIKIINSSTLSVTLDYPCPSFLANLATHYADPYIDDQLPAGLGPFKLDHWDTGKEIILTPFDEYYEGRPTIDELHFLIIRNDREAYELFKQGRLSIYLPGSAMVRKIKTESPQLLYTIPELSLCYLCMNCQQEPFSNKRVRQAISYAIDKQKFVATFFKDTAIMAQGVFPPSLNVPAEARLGYSYDPRKARELLNESGYPQGLPDTYLFDVGATPALLDQAEFVKTNLSDIGISIDINAMSAPELMKKTAAGKSALSFQHWLSDSGDPDDFVYPLFHSSLPGVTPNASRVSLPDLDQEIDRARTMRSHAERKLAYRKIERQILDEAPGVFLYHRLLNIAAQHAILGLKPFPLGYVRAKYLYPEDDSLSTRETATRTQVIAGTTHEWAHIRTLFARRRNTTQ